MARASATARLAEYRRKRDFSRTKEPSGGGTKRPAATRKKVAARRPARSKKAVQAGKLRFVVQKHAASHLHFDLRLELEGTMKSWAVPKGPSTDPGVKRLAMQVEDHPIEYNEFEGTIPEGQYGGGTVMIWDLGTYIPEETGGSGDDDEAAMRERYRKGDVKIEFRGKRLRGSYALVRMKPRGESASKPAWLLIKHRDRYAAKSDIVAKHRTSAVSGRTMEEIAGEKRGKVWQSNRAGTAKRVTKTRAVKRPSTKRRGAARTAVRRPPASGKVTASTSRKLATLKPMLATIGSVVPSGENWAFEHKYDGIRVLAWCTKEDARLITRNGLDKSRQFPEITEALRTLASSVRRPLVLDGEIVAVTGGAPARFQELQGRMHVTNTAAIAGHRESSPAAIVLFDILMDGEEPLVHEPWTERRKRLEKRVGKRVSSVVRLSHTQLGKGEKLLARARREGWEGVIAKKTDAPYEPGVRSRSWLKLKIEHRQEFVVGGWTEPRQSRQHIGAILLGYYDDDGDLIYAGHTGGGFSQRTLAEVHALLEPLERETSPFGTKPKTNERAHWAEPKVVVEVKFNEWTADGKLRQPIFLGVRADKRASAVRREAESVQ